MARRRLSPDVSLSPTEGISDDDDSSSASGCEPSLYEGAEPHLAGLLTSRKMLRWMSLAIWPLINTVPLVLSNSWSFTSYKYMFPKDWYSYNPHTEAPSYLGLSLGIVSVAVGQVFVLFFFYFLRKGYFSGDCAKPTPVQSKGAPSYFFSEGLQTHLSQPGGFILLGTYLAATWIFRLLPSSYYSFNGTIQWQLVFMCLVVQDGLQYAMHRMEHIAHPMVYKISHKPHHKFTNPRLFDAYNGSLPDTCIMILIPLFLTAHIVRNCNVWTYMSFGSLYANWLTMIHSEYVLPWDGVFRAFGLGTPGDHHVHHKFFIYNYGHLCMWFDMIGGTYRRPENFAPKIFNHGV